MPAPGYRRERPYVDAPGTLGRMSDWRSYDAVAETYERIHAPRLREPARDLILAADPAPGARVLDVGTGTGAALALLAGRFPDAELVGVDIAPSMLAEARRVLPADVLARARLEVADAAALPFAEREFDLVTLQNAIPFPAELGRVVAPGGTVVVAFSRGPETPIWTPPETLKRLLAVAGFERFEEVTAGAGTALLARRS